ncbi:MAG: enoyl-CoA hydratase/isomerase family protein [Pseudorhodoplanes sp.]|nr:Carnitinyl-CoA dehydratase [Pseudorhodoplanes sp.]MBW7949556.1 enoyl-CoA hydratase/isomerase family protein [Pseudorhodoplanes sp.]MCL4711673.1 enoyl-CoA hydratase/isomerase family protein [Pseudorhodoplanes sp.]MCQ3943027.1 enoyl-CoA hydratase/isomerase family protein [Alphaproteobacteria bacterium]GIK81414.1 MAG: crotonase [Alphaproteobacteria bacterium]
MYKDIAVERRGRIVCVTLNRPERANAISVATSAELLKVFTEYRDDPEQWVMIIAGAGEKSFCSGMYVTEAAEKTAAKGRTEGYTIFKPWTDMMQSIHKPFICAVNGACVGGGWHLVADSDIVIASDNAVFLDTHVNIGLINGVESAGFAFKMPLGIVMRMVVEGRYFRVNAQQALQWGLVSEVLPQDRLMAKAWEIAGHIADEAAPLAVQGSKKAILGALDRGPTEGIPYTWTVLTDIQDTEDTKEGFRSFVEKRKPKFVGR